MPKRLFALIAVLTLFLAACGNDDDDDATPPPADNGVTDPGDEGDEPSDPPENGEGATVESDGMAFSPATVEISAGETVTWNGSSLPHTVTSTDGPMDFDESLSTGDSVSITFDEPGTYEYECTFHQGMTGTIVVS